MDIYIYKYIFFASLSQGWSLMILVTADVSQSLSVHVCTTTKSTSQESPTRTTVDPGKMNLCHFVAELKK